MLSVLMCAHHEHANLRLFRHLFVMADVQHGPAPCFSIPANAGFKLDTLLRLADVKGTDRRTSLLAFVTAALLARGQGDVGSLPQQLSSIRPAANLQVLAAVQWCQTRTTLDCRRC